MKPCRQARDRGFTLIEVIVSIALFALLMSLVYSGFSTAVRAYDAAEQRVGEVERMRVVSAFIRRSVSGAPALAIAVRGEWSVQFEGAPQRLRYIADLPGYVGGGGLHEVVLEVEQDGEQHDLVMRRRAVSIDRFGDLGGEFETRVLSEQIVNLALRFYGRTDERDEPEWRDDWPSGKTMPLLVELIITPKSGLAWPPLQVRPLVDSIRYVKTPRAGSAAQPAAPVEHEDGDSQAPSGASQAEP